MDKFAELEQYIIEHRRNIHRNPELGFECGETHDYLKNELKRLGIQVHQHIGKNSLVGVIKNGQGPVIGLRADFDALPLQEETNLEFKSKNPGKMHACGHDAHTECYWVQLGTCLNTKTNGREPSSSSFKKLKKDQTQEEH